MGKKDSDFHEFISQMVDIQFLWRQGLSQARKRKKCIESALLRLVRLAPCGQHTHATRIYICTYADTHSFVLLPVDRRCLSFCPAVSLTVRPSVGLGWSGQTATRCWGPDFQNRLMIVTFISAIRQLVPADYPPLNTAITAVPHVKIIRIHCWNIYLACNTRRY